MYEPDLKQMLSILPEDAAVCIYGIPRSLWRSPFGNQWCGDAMDVPLGVFPACAGVSLALWLLQLLSLRFPRVCGGEPIQKSLVSSKRLFSPRVRG